LLIDSDVLVWLTRGHVGAAKRLHAINPWRITAAISERAARLIDGLALSHGLRLAGALIGATAIEHGVTLLTANAKHFAAIDGLTIDAFEP
jgi:predicted nucleic acid-binding protein